ncbi:hypothetical protein OEZ85_003206 [Tetradesmus obliquus]|uniref:Cation-transporting P-type ATPase C-terminal domain-containing protein n=1 Tax=Tetradesmus obliquus TaxID=3088 RepID=A0ABY8U418_TETOB|nr:hypothetical protein OEZ85_003206 [Tetradesmus obliquus]
MKGAPQVVLRRAHNFEAIHAGVEQKIIEYASRGYRALGFGLAEGPGGPDAPGTQWQFLGLLPLFDPPRHDTAETIERCHAQGIAVKMVTGDQALIGVETARQLGMGTNIHKIEVLLQAKAGGGLVDGHADVGQLVEAADGFAEVFPEHKFEIVAMLQARDHMVGMTGDGVNDAPALKKADVGIAMHGATEAARGAADIVLTEPELSVIVEAAIVRICYLFLPKSTLVLAACTFLHPQTEPGLSVMVEAVIGARCIFQRMTTYAKYFPTILIVLLAVFNDGAMITLSKDHVTPSPLPNSWQLKHIFIVGIVYGLYLTLSTWVLYHVASKMTFFESHLHMTPSTTQMQSSSPSAAACWPPEASPTLQLPPSA